MSQRVKRPNRTDDGSVPTKRRKRPTVEEEEVATLAAASWQPRPFNDLKSIYNRTATEAPAELFRKDLISAMKLPDSEPLASDEYWVIVDQWKQEWERGVQVPVNPDSLPEPCVTVNQCVPVKSQHEFRMPKSKYIRITKDENFSLDEHILSTAPTKAEAACFYDLDECDVAWLKLLNGERSATGMGPVSEEQLERVIERLEINCWEKLQSILRNEEGLGIEYDENVICDVCRSPDSEEGNEMVFCDSCNICVHQACYGITRIPEGQWLCGTCTLAQRPDCVLCPNKGGAMKATRSGQKWAHVSCALWIPEVSIGCVEKMEPITKISSIPQSRWALICVLCRERVGACIQCSVKTCKTAYHVTCAFKHGLEMRAIIEDENADDGVKLRSYCEKHSKTSKKEKSVCSGSDDDDNKRKKRKDMTSEEKNQARAARLQEIESEFDKHVSIKDVNIQVDVDNEALQYIYNYWILKRRAGNNRPLLLPKFEDVDMLSHKQEQADLEKMKMFVQLRQDLERVRNLCYMVSRREKLSRTFFRMREQTFHKQAAVLAFAGHSLSPSIIQSVIEANHGPSIYDKLYSHSDAEDHTKDFDLVLARIAGIKSPLNEYNDVKKPELNGLLKSVKDNPYKKLYFNGSSKRRSASLYGSSTSGASSSDELSKDMNRMRSSTDDDKMSPSPVLKKKVVKSHKRNINNKRKNVSGASHSKIDSSSEDDVRPSKNDWKKLSRSRLQQMEHELGVSGTDSDGVMTIHPSKSEESQKVKAASIYSDSDTDSSIKKFNKLPGTQHNRSRSKPAAKEFSQNPLTFRSSKKTKDKKLNKTSKKVDKKNYVPSDLIVPQRQAAKKASENLKSTSSSRIKDQLLSLTQAQQIESEAKVQPSVSSDDKLKQKSKLKPKETKSSVVKREVKHFNDVFDIEKELDKEENSEILSYVPQRQAAKKAAEHIKSGLVKPSTDTSTSETEKIRRDQEVKSKTDLKISKKENDFENPAKIVESRQQRKSSSNSSSSSTSNSSSDSASSSSSESEDEPSKPQKQSRSESLFSSPPRDQTKRANSKDWPFLDKAAKSAGCSSTSESSDSSRPPSPTKSSLVISPSKTSDSSVQRSQEIRAKPAPRKLPDKRFLVEREEPTRIRTGGRGRPPKARTRSRNSCDTVGDSHVRSRDTTNAEPVEERDFKGRKGKSNEMAESPKKEIAKSNDLFVAVRKEDKKLNDKIERLELSNLEREILERKAGRDKELSSNKSKCSLDRLLDLKVEKSRSFEKLLKSSEMHSKLLEVHEEIQRNNTGLSSNKINKSHDKVKKSLYKVRKSPDEFSQSFRKVRKSSERVSKSPERVSKSPERVSKSPERVSKSPERVSKSPERVSKSPEKVSKSPEKYPKSPNKAPKSPDRYSIPDNMVPRLSDKHSKSPNKSIEKHLKSPAERYLLKSPVKENKEPPSFEQEGKIQVSPAKYKSVESSNVADIKRIKTTPKFNNIQEDELITKPYILEENRRFENEDENKTIKTIEVQKVYETTNNKIEEIQNELEGKGQLKLGRSIFSPPHTNKDSDLLDFDILDDGFGIPKDEEIMKGPLSFSFSGIALFKEDSKEDSARETLNLVEKLRFELSKKSTSYDVDDTASIASSTRNDGERIDMEQIVPNDLGEISKDEKIAENPQLQLEVRVNVTDMPKPIVEEKVQLGCDNDAFMQSDKAIHQQPHELLDHSSSAQADERWVPPSDTYRELDHSVQPPLQTYNSIPQTQTYIQQFPNSNLHQIMPPQIELRVQEELHKNLSPSLHDRRISQTPYLEQSSLDCMPSPSPYADMHPQAKWADSQVMPTRRSSSSSAGSSSSSCSRRTEVEDELMKRTEVMMMNHPNLELQFGILHQGIPPFPPNSLDPYPPYSESQFVSPVSLFPPPPNINTQIPFPSPGAAMFPPAFGTPFPATHSVIPPLPKPVDDTMRFSTACTAAFTSSQHNMALTAAMVNLPQLASKEEELPCVTEAEIQSSVAEQLPSSPQPNVTLSAQSPIPSSNEPSPTLSNTTPTTNHVEPSPNASLKSNSSSGGKKSPSKPTRTSARFISQQQNKSPSKSPAGKSPSGPGRSRGENKRGSGRGASRGQSQTRGRGRGRGRGKSDYNTIHNKLVGTVYDLDFDDDISTDNMGDLKAMRERRKSADVHDRKLDVRDSSQSPKFASPSSHKGRSYNDLRDLRPPTPISEEKCDSPVPPSIVDDPPQFPDIVQPVLPGPVDMRTYNSFDSQSYTEANLLGAFASGTVAESQVHEDIDEDFEKELHSALTGTKPDGESEPPVPEIANNIKVSLSDSRNQLKVKIKGPIANYTSSVVPPLPPVLVDSNAASNVSTSSSNNNVITNVSMGTNSGTSNLRRMRKKELLRQYWTQDMNNMDEPAVSGIVAAPAAPQINRTIITIPKAVASMTSIPTRDDYRDYRTGADDVLETKIRKESKARTGVLSRELRHLDMPIDDDAKAERRRSVGSTGSNECVIGSKRRGRPANSKQLQTPKLKIKIGGNSIVGGVNRMDEKKDRIRPPKKRLATIAQPSVEDLKRESMKFRKMVMADFGEVRKKKKDKSSKHKKRKTQEVQIISNESTNSTKLIIRFGRKTSSNENETNKRTSSDISGSVDSKILASPIVDLSKDVANISKVCEPIKVTPIKLKLSRCHEGSVYVMKSTELDDVKVRKEGKKEPSPPLAPPHSLLSPLKLPDSAHTPPAPLPISKDCEVR